MDERRQNPYQAPERAVPWRRRETGPKLVLSFAVPHPVRPTYPINNRSSSHRLRIHSLSSPGALIFLQAFLAASAYRGTNSRARTHASAPSFRQSPDLSCPLQIEELASLGT